MSTSETSIGRKKYVKADDALAEFDDEITLGRLMRSLRKCEDLTVTAMAEKLGVNKQFLSAVENDRKQVGIDFIRAFAGILDTHPDPLLEIYFRDMLRRHGITNMEVTLRKVS